MKKHRIGNLRKSVAAFRTLVESLIELSELGDDECDLFEKEWREAHKDVKKL